MILKDIRYLMTQNKNRQILEHVDIRIEDGLIEEVGENLDGDEALDCSNKVVLPGLINCHAHVSMTIFRGISDNKNLNDWLQEDIFPAEEEMTDEDVYKGAKLGIAEMLKTGTTCFNDMYAPEEKVAEAVEETGIRAVLGQGFIDIEGDTQDKLAKSREFIEKYMDHERITLAVNPHSIYTCSEGALAGGKRQSEEYDLPLHIHLSETKNENEDAREEYDKSPTEYLNSLGLLSSRTIAAHCTHLSEDDKHILAENNVGVAHNPCANLKLGSGIADIPDLLSRDITVGLGTDGVASNNNLNLFEEMKFTSLIQKEEDPEAMTEQQTLDMATINGARVLGLEDEIGSVEEGKKADIITVDLDREDVRPVESKEDVISHLVFSFNGEVSDVFVNGQRLV